MTVTAHHDTFARDHLPPRDQWPELIFGLPEFNYPKRINCATELLDKAVTERGWGERRAIISPRGCLTFRQLLEAANRIARVLVEDLDLVPGNRVLLYGRNNPLLAACWFAVEKAGAIAVATMPLMRAKELVEIITKAKISHALCDQSLAAELELARPACPTLRHVEYFYGREAGLEARMAAKPADFANASTAADDTALIAFTSGTTGKPKGTMHFHRDVLAVCDAFPKSILKAAADDIFCGTPPLAFTYGLGGLLLFPLRVGAAAVLTERTTPEALLKTIQDHRATVCFTAPTFYRMMAEQVKSYDIASLAKCVSAGEALPLATRRAWRDATGIDIIDGLGATEMLHIFVSAAGAEIRPGATGRAVPGYQVAILDDHGQPVPPGTVGRLAVKGPTGCRYLDDPRQTEFVQGGWNFPGDSYLMDADGYCYYQARSDGMIISAGYNISGAEVEEALLAHPAVLECGVVGVPDEERGQLVKACVVLKPGYAGDQAMARELQEHVKRTIAPYKYPRLVEFRDTLPRTGSGKLQRFNLRQA